MLDLAVCIVSNTDWKGDVICYAANFDALSTCTATNDGLYMKVPSTPDPNANIVFTDSTCSTPAPTQHYAAVDPTQLSKQMPTDLSATPYYTSAMVPNMWVRMPTTQSESACPANLTNEQQMAKECIWYLPANG